MQLVDAEIRMRAVRQADRCRGAAYFLHCHDVRKVAECGAAELFLDRYAEQSELAKLRPQVAGELVVRVDSFGARRNSVPGKRRYRLT